MKKIKSFLSRNLLLRTLPLLRGNPRACLYLEPFWGLPYNLYAPFVSVYMAALGMTPVQIGFVSTVFFASQMVFALLSGPLTDKLGRRKCTLIFDCISWSIPTFLWMCAQNYAWFIVAALFNGVWRVTENSWDLLLIEDAPEDQLVTLYSISHIAGLLAGFVTPLAYIFVQKFGLVPTVRVLYGFACVMMTFKFVTLYFWSKETKVGEKRMQECKNESIFASVRGSLKVLKTMIHNRRIVRVVIFMACFAALKNVNDTFWPLLVRDKLLIAEENLSIFSTVKSLMMLACYFIITPHLHADRFHHPLRIGLMLFLLEQVLMLLIRPGMYAAIILGVMLEAVALSMLNPLMQSVQVAAMDVNERARMMGLSFALSMLVTSPVGTLAGVMSEINRALPLCMNLVFIAVCLHLSFKISEKKESM